MMMMMMTLNYSAFIFVASFIAENSATRREDKQTKCNNAEHTFATDNKRRDCIFRFYTASN